MLRELDQRVPEGTPVGEAIDTMKTAGFDCDLVPHETGEYLVCRIERGDGMFVSTGWGISLKIEDGSVTERWVSSYSVGP